MSYNINTIRNNIETLQGVSVNQDGSLQLLADKVEEGHLFIENAIAVTPAVEAMRDGWMPTVQSGLDDIVNTVSDLIDSYSTYGS